MSLQDALARIVYAFDHCEIAYMLTGSFASVHYGSPRSTQDIDFVIVASDDQLRRFVASLSAGQYYADVDAALEANRRHSMFNVLDVTEGWKIDCIMRKPRPFSAEEFRRRQSIEVSGINLFAATAEDVIVSKLEWAKLGQSQRHVEDAAGVLKMRWNTLDRRYIAKWVGELGLGEEFNHALKIAEVAG